MAVIEGSRVGAVDSATLMAGESTQFSDVDSSYYEATFNDIVSGYESSNDPTCSLIGAETIIDRSLIEQQAYELINNHLHTNEAYKTEQTYKDDARTLLFEALTKSGFLSEVRISGTLEEIHKTMLVVLLNSYDKLLPAHEQRRRFQELCAELVRQAIELKQQAGELADDLEVGEISDYIAPHAMSNKSAKRIGYRPSNKKGMLRSSRLIVNQDGTYTRVTKQVSRSNADAKRSKQFLKGRSVAVGQSRFDDVDVLGAPFLHSAQQGVVGLMRALDAHQGQGIRYGEPESQDQVPYEQLESVSAERERVMLCYIDKLAIFTELLDTQKRSGLINQKEYSALFQREVGNILRAICVMDPSYAVSCFGERAEAGFIEASNLVAAGNFSAAEAVLIQNMKLEQTVSFCGGSISNEDAEALGIKIDSVGDLLRKGRQEAREKFGQCRVENCPSPRSTKVGGCNICLDRCQPLFDKGWKYETIVAYYGRNKKRDLKTGSKSLSFALAA